MDCCAEVVAPHGLEINALTDSAGMEAQENDEVKEKFHHYAFGWSFGEAYHLSRKMPSTTIPTNHNVAYFSLNMNFRSLEADSSLYDMAFGLPELEAGFMFGYFRDVKLKGTIPGCFTRSHMGNQYTAFYGFCRDFMRNRRWNVGFSLQNGIGLTTEHYSKHNNPDNRFIGSNFTLYFGAGLYAKYVINPHWEASVELGFKHYSNSGMDRPNLGTNTIGLQARVNYYPSPILTQPRKLHYNIPAIKKDFYLDVTTGWEGKALLEEWNYNEDNLTLGDDDYLTGHYRIRTQWNTSLAGMFRYNLKYASGLALDYSYVTYDKVINHIQEMRGINNHRALRHVLGISLRHEVFYKQMSMVMNFGMYPYRHMGTTNKHLIYETVGLRWYPKSWGNFYMSYNVKAHGMRADGLQINLGYRILRRNKLYD